MQDLMEAALRGHQADYIEIRIERGESSRITYRGRELEDIGRTTSVGGNVRALVQGGWGFASFNSLEGLRERVALAVRSARLVRGGGAALAPIPSVVDRVPVQLKRDPFAVSIEDKKRLMEEYNDIVWAGGPRIQTSAVRYGDSRRTVYFATTEGTYLEQEKVDLTAVVSAIAREGSDVQQGFVSVGSNDDYGAVDGLHQEVEKATRRAVELLSAKPVKPGEYPVVADGKMAGLFVHEAFGHLSEADHVYENERLREVMVLGRRFGRPLLNIADSAAEPGLRGSYKYDDEGTPSSRTYLLREGVLVGRLHSRETAAKMGEQPTGNARALNYRFRPIVRMTNTFIDPGDTAFEDMIAGIKEGVYAIGGTGGETSMEMFTFTASEGRMIRDGKLAEPVRNVSLSGNVFQTLANIEAIGPNPTFNTGGGCGKGGQMPLPVTEGSPHIRISNIVVGGR